MKRFYCLLVILLIWPVLALAKDCKFPKKGPDPKAFVYKVGDLITVTGDRQNTQAEIVKVVPWWDMTDCQWKVNYEAEVKNIFRFSENDPLVQLARPGGKK